MLDSEPSTPDHVETQFVAGEGGRFAFRRSGPTGSPPLVMCHRFRGTIDDWDPAFLDPLTAERDVIVFDNLGVGRSSGEVQSTAAAMAEGAVEFIDLLGIDVFDVLGWSMGGFVAQAIALSAPGRVRRLIVAAAKPGMVPGAPQTSQEASQVAGKPVNDEEDFLFLFFPHTPAGREAGAASQRRIEGQTRGAPTTVSAPAAIAQTQALMSWSRGQDAAWERLAELSMPVLVGHGAHDILMDVYNAYATAIALQHGTLVLYGDAAHAFLFQHADAFAQQVLDFVR
jgi:pimeloyl-ACP methyl ester carboxylesterase